MFTFNYAEGATLLSSWGAMIAIFFVLIAANEFIRAKKIRGLLAFIVLPIILTIIWLTVLSDIVYTDWFHIAKVYSATAGCIGFWFITYYEKKDKTTGEVKWRLKDTKFAMIFPPLILGINILEAVARDFQMGSLGLAVEMFEGQNILSGSWNYMNGIAGILNIIAITGWVGITVAKKTGKHNASYMIWPDMLWFWIIAYDIWNFAYTYNCLPGHSWYCGIAMLLAPTAIALTRGKGGWLQHRAQTLAIWCMFAQTFPTFQDQGMFSVSSTYNPTIYFAVSFLALAANIAVVGFMIYTAVKTKRNPYKEELYTDLQAYKDIKALAE